jgi:hypothetical protein
MKKSTRCENQMLKGKYLRIGICPKQSGTHPCWNRFLRWDSARKSQAAQNGIICPYTKKMTREGKNR